MIRFKLNDIFQGGIERQILCQSAERKGVNTYKRLAFLPGKVYRLTDPVSIQTIKGKIGDVMEKMVLTSELKAELEAHDVKYTLKKCGTCTNAKTKAFFNPFVIVEDDHADERI